MIVVAKNTLREQGSQMSVSTVKWAVNNGTPLAVLNRPLTRKPEAEDAVEDLINGGASWPVIDTHLYEDDITEAELAAGLAAVRDVCIYYDEMDLLKSYLQIHLKGQDEALLKELKEIKLDEINGDYEGAVAELKKKEYIPVSEMLTFTAQEIEAKAYRESGFADETVAPTLKGIAEARGVSLKGLSEKVLIKANLYRQGLAKLIGERQRAQDNIQDATTTEMLEKVTFITPKEGANEG